MEPHKNRLMFIVPALLLPFISCLVQWQFWSVLKPFVWFLFYPTVFFSSRIVSTAISALLVVYFFIPPQLSVTGKNTNNLYSVAVFLLMGLLFSYTHDRLERAKLRTAEAQEAARIADEQLQEARICQLQAEQKLTEDHLHMSEERFRKLFNSAPVQRIIHRHGGEISAEAEPGKGATFRFTLAGSGGQWNNRHPG